VARTADRTFPVNDSNSTCSLFSRIMARTRTAPTPCLVALYFAKLPHTRNHDLRKEISHAKT